MRIDIPGRAPLQIENIVFDFNGTLATGGELDAGVREHLDELGHYVKVTILTADTFGSVEKSFSGMDIKLVLLEGQATGEQKAEFVRSLGAQTTVAVGNGTNDEQMLRESVIGIAVLGGEGCASAAMFAADLIVTDIRDAIQLFLDPTRIIAGLRK